MLNPFSLYMIGMMPIAILAIGGIIWIALLIFWVWMFIDCAKREFKEAWVKAVMILVVIFGSWFGAIIYYLLYKKGVASPLSLKRLYCPRCGTKIAEDENFCQNCGLNVSEKPTSPNYCPSCGATLEKGKCSKCKN